MCRVKGHSVVQVSEVLNRDEREDFGNFLSRLKLEKQKLSTSVVFMDPIYSSLPSSSRSRTVGSSGAQPTIRRGDLELRILLDEVYRPSESTSPKGRERPTQ